MKASIAFKPRLLSELRHYSKEKFAADAMSGLIVGIVALPLAIAFGIASGVSPEQGILTAIIGGFIVSFFGGSRVQIGGPTGAFIVIISGIVSNPALGMSGLIAATIMAGIILKEDEEMTVDEMKKYILDHMARHKVPKYIDFVTEFPMNAAGKILKYKMRDESAEILGLKK